MHPGGSRDGRKTASSKLSACVMKSAPTSSARCIRMKAAQIIVCLRRPWTHRICGRPACGTKPGRCPVASYWPPRREPCDQIDDRSRRAWLAGDSFSRPFNLPFRMRFSAARYSYHSAPAAHPRDEGHPFVLHGQPIRDCLLKKFSQHHLAKLCRDWTTHPFLTVSNFRRYGNVTHAFGPNSSPSRSLGAPARDPTSDVAAASSACVSALASAVWALEPARRYCREKTLDWYRGV
jgi:hypothetical protein